MLDSLGDRMKAYESCGNIHLIRRMPLIVRVDGRAFHTLTRRMDKPFDARFMAAMCGAATELAEEMQGFLVGYVQSDEASFFLQDYALLDTEPWFGKDLSKVVSLSAARMSVTFSRMLDVDALFDSRAFIVPEGEVVNYFLWRARDWSRNSLSAYAQAHFSDRELHGKDATAKHEMLHGVGKNWTNDLTPRERNGLFIVRSGRSLVFRDDVLPNFASVSEAVESAALTAPETQNAMPPLGPARAEMA